MMTTTQLPAAALAAAPEPKMSSRYVHIDTREVVRLMTSEGWVLAGAQSANPRKRNPLYVQHLLDFRRPDSELEHELAPRILFFNSHNGTVAARAMAGFFRFACANGLVVGAELASVRARHTGRDAHEFVHEAQALEKVLVEQRHALERWQQKHLTIPQLEEYGRLVSQLRYGDAWAAEPGRLLAPRRQEDDSGTLYAAFNRAQENTVRGGWAARAASGRRVTTQPLNSIESNLSYNTKLWRMTSELAEFW